MIMSISSRSLFRLRELLGKLSHQARNISMVTATCIPVAVLRDGLSAFLLTEDEENAFGLQVSMPYGGLLSFLSNIRQNAMDRLMVSMPYDGLSAFLCTLMYKNKGRGNVSMPYGGPSAFLRFPSELRLNQGLLALFLHAIV